MPARPLARPGPGRGLAPGRGRGPGVRVRLGVEGQRRGRGGPGQALRAQQRALQEDARLERPLVQGLRLIGRLVG
jgi:hypothetical protein